MNANALSCVSFTHWNRSSISAVVLMTTPVFSCSSVSIGRCASMPLNTSHGEYATMPFDRARGGDEDMAASTYGSAHVQCGCTVRLGCIYLPINAHVSRWLRSIMPCDSWSTSYGPFLVHIYSFNHCREYSFENRCIIVYDSSGVKSLDGEPTP